MNEISVRSTSSMITTMLQDSQQKANIKTPAEVIKIIREAQKEVRSMQDREVVLVVGNTGAGKSTFINFMAGKQQTVGVSSSGDQIVETIDPITVEGHGNKAETTYPHVYSIGTPPLHFCDCPGFRDNRGNEVEIANAAALSQLAKTCKRIKCLVLCIEFSNAKAVRSEALDDTIETTLAFLGQDTLIDSVFLLFTKTILHTAAAPEEIVTRNINSYCQKSRYVKYLCNLKDGGNVGFYFPVGNAPQHPLVYNRESIRKKIMSFQGIDDPQNHFKTTISPKANTHIVSCLKWAQDEIFSHIRNRDLNAVGFVELLNSMYDLKELAGAHPSIGDVISSFSQLLSIHIAELRYANDAVPYLTNLANAIPPLHPLRKMICDTLAFSENRMKKEKEDVEKLKTLSEQAHKLTNEKAAIEKALKNKEISFAEAEKRNAIVEAKNKELQEKAIKIQQEKDKADAEKKAHESGWKEDAKVIAEIIGALFRGFLTGGVPSLLQSRL